MPSVDDQIQSEITLYVTYCQAAAKHGSDEQYWRDCAHKIFYHIIELRSTSKVPIS